MHHVGLHSHNRKAYIAANALLLAFFLVLVSQIVMQNVMVASYQSRLFQKEIQDKIDIKTGVYRAIANINNNIDLLPDTELSNGEHLVINITGNNDEKIVTVSKNNLKAIVSLYRVDKTQPNSPPSYQWIIYKWAWVP